MSFNGFGKMLDNLLRISEAKRRFICTESFTGKNRSVTLK